MVNILYEYYTHRFIFSYFKMTFIVSQCDKKQNISGLREVLFNMVQHGLVLPPDFLIVICKGILCVKWSGHHVLRHCVSFKRVGNSIPL